MSSSSIRIKVQLPELTRNDRQKDPDPVLKFVYIIDSPSQTTIAELIRILQKYINEQFLNNNTQIVQLTTNDGFILPKSYLSSMLLKDNDHIICIDMPKFAQENFSTLNLNNLWLELKQHDASDNQEKFIQIGLTNFFKLFLRLRANSNKFGIYIFNVFELTAIANEKRRDNLIARIDNKDNSDKKSSTDWFLEAKWEYDTGSNKDLFIICNLKVASSDEVCSNKLHITLDQSSVCIEKGEITRLSSATNSGAALTDQQRQRLKELTAKLPPPKRTGPQINLNNNETLKVAKHECEGESSIRMAYGNTNTVTTYQSSDSPESGTVNQYVCITHIIFSKKPLVLPEILNQKRSQPVDKPVSVANLTLFYQTYDESWRECQDIAIAPVTTRNEEPKWLTDSIINIEPDKLISFMIKGWIRTKGDSGKDHEARNRIHKSLPQPFKLKIVTTDNFGKQCSLVVEQLNKPLKLTTRESFLNSNQTTINELLAFVYADDCDADERVYMVVYLDKENALVVKNTDSYSLTYERKVVRVMEFNAKKNKTTEVPLEQIDYKYYTNESKATVLFDPETYILYGIRMEISTKTSKTEETIPIPIEKIQ